MKTKLKKGQIVNWTGKDNPGRGLVIKERSAEFGADGYDIYWFIEKKILWISENTLCLELIKYGKQRYND